MRQTLQGIVLVVPMVVTILVRILVTVRVVKLVVAVEVPVQVVAMVVQVVQVVQDHAQVLVLIPVLPLVLENALALVIPDALVHVGPPVPIAVQDRMSIINMSKLNRSGETKVSNARNYGSVAVATQLSTRAVLSRLTIPAIPLLI